VNVSFGRFQLSPHRRELLANGRPVQIGGRAFDLLVALLESRGSVVSKETLMRCAWPDQFVEQSNLQNQISALRAVLGADRDLIRTVPRRGYQFIGEIQIGPATSDERRDVAGVGHKTDLPLTKARELVPGSTDRNSELLESRIPPEMHRAAALIEPDGSGKTRPGPRRGNVSASWVELIGQADAVRQVEQLILAHRVVTLAGPGGIGKTTLGLEVARGLIDAFEGGTWLVELASLSNTALVPSAVARVLGLRLSGEQIASETVARAIGEKRLLLVLDSCEHVIDSVVDLIAAVLRVCPKASILATSREFLMVEGEHVYRVPPLEVPPERPPERGDVLRHSSVQLLVARTKALNSDFAPQETQFALLAAISRRLDGIPLAIELAAARVATLGLDHVAAGLDDRLGLLTTGRRAAAPRHQTLRATLDWSYELLSDFEQRLLCNLAVFQGGFAIESSTAAFGAEHSASDIAEGITRLLTKSLISPHGAEGRWRLLDTLRAYAIEKLEQVGEIGSARHRHAKYFCSFILANSEDARGTADVLVANVQDIDNVRAAIDWAFSTIGDNHIGIALTAAYIPVWCHFALFGECRERIEQALKCPAVSIDANARYRMQLHAGRAWVILASRNSCPETFDAWTKTLEIAEALADADFQLRALWGLFTEQITRGDCHVALRIAERFKTIAESTDRTDVLIGHRLMGNALHSLGRQSEAGSYNERFLAEEPALANQRPVGFRFQFDQGVIIRTNQARILWLQGYADQAMRVAADAVRIAQSLDHPMSLAMALFHGACPVSLLATDLPAAESWVRLLLDLSIKHAMEPWTVRGQCLMGMLLTKKHADKSQGISMIRTALSELPESAFHLHYAQILANLAEALGLCGQAEQGLATLEPAFARYQRTGEAWYLPELMRMKGELLLQKEGNQALSIAEDHFVQALHLAGQQGALAWQLRAAMSLARLRQPNDRDLDAQQSLQSIYEKFTEGFGTKDLISAKQLLDQRPSHEAFSRPGIGNRPTQAPITLITPRVGPSSHGAKGAFGSSLAAHFHLNESEHVSTAWPADNIFAVTRLQADTGIPDRTTPVPREAALLVSVSILPVPLGAYQLWINGKTIDVPYIPSLQTSVMDLESDPVCWVGTGFDYVHYHVPKTGLDEIARDHGVEPVGSYRFTIREHDTVLAQLTQHVIPFIGSRDWTNSLMLDQFSLILGAHVLRTYAGLPPLAVTKRGGLATWQERRAAEMMSENLDGNVHLSELARECGLSVSHFTRAFRKSFGVSPYRWLLERRIDHAKVLLVTGDLPIANIAMQSGFSDQAAFTRVFGRIVGDSPGRWKRAVTSRA
jgi:predicted ATPase/DNA-binding winged helix-turn-helix (wHTH) protein/AraC-like DNA-binding protein